ncbi:MAG: hypothetical protein JKY86_15505 [Gammaproteobacteria bacterium]|nr:hypothetical protein [Gammaproteobacteria bacterium]
MDKFLATVITIIILLIIILTGTSGNLDHVKEGAEESFSKHGFDVIGYEGYQWGMGGYNSYGGAYVWYTIRRQSDNGITYNAALQRWGDELHMYKLTAIDAIKP